MIGVPFQKMVEWLMSFFELFHISQTQTSTPRLLHLRWYIEKESSQCCHFQYLPSVLHERTCSPVKDDIDRRDSAARNVALSKIDNARCSPCPQLCPAHFPFATIQLMETTAAQYGAQFQLMPTVLGPSVPILDMILSLGCTVPVLYFPSFQR